MSNPNDMRTLWPVKAHRRQDALSYANPSLNVHLPKGQLTLQLSYINDKNACSDRRNKSFQNKQ